MANKFLKRPIVTQVDFAIMPGTIITLEGEVPYQTGDALMTGECGECWSISRVKFDATYDAVLPTKHGKNGGYVKKSISVTAVQLRESMQVALSGVSACISGNPGDWLINAPDGSQWIVADGIFRKTYIPLEEA